MVCACVCVHAAAEPWQRLAGGWEVLSATTTRCAYDNSSTQQVWATVFLSSVPHCLWVDARFRQRLRATTQTEAIASAVSTRAVLITNSSAPTLVSRRLSMLCLATMTSVGRECGVCDTTIPHFNPFVDGCSCTHRWSNSSFRWCSPCVCDVDVL